MNYQALKKAILTEIDFDKERLAYYQTLVNTDPDNMTAVKMLYFYKGQLEVLHYLYWF